MSLTHLAVRNFQALKNVDLDLGTFTVIVGPSSSGKSSLIRAFRALASNVRGTGVITRGQKQMAITATIDNGVKVTLERGDRSSAYRLSGDGQQQFTKLAGEVPEQITATLRLDPGQDSVNFAGQFDKPYLLDESGSTIARQLGELTNVNQIFEAVRQANRIRTSTQATLRTRTADMSSIREQLRAFTGLSEQLEAFSQVQALDEARQALQARLGRLETATRALRMTETALVKYKPVDLPDTTALQQLLNRLESAQTLVRRMAHLTTAVRDTKESFDGLTEHVEKVEKELAAAKAKIKICPTCGQTVS